MIPVVAKAKTDCALSKRLGESNLGLQCQASFKQAVTDVKAVVTDIKAGNITQAITDAEKLQTDVDSIGWFCKSQTTLEKATAFSFGFLASTNVRGNFNGVDI